MVGVVLMREEKAFSEEKKKILQVAPNCAALKSLIFLVGGLLSRWYRSKLLEGC